jgi:hypothetical protein
MLSEPGPQIIPTIAPNMSAANIRFQRAISNQVATIFFHQLFVFCSSPNGDPLSDGRTIEEREI